jgi:hypothetical protein
MNAKIKTADLTGPALDWAVAACMGYTNLHHRKLKGYEVLTTVLAMDAPYGWVELSDLNYSNDWAHGGPIIEREIVSIDKEDGGKRWAAFMWRSDRDLQKMIGPTPLIAAMRCYVASKLGDEIEVPKELA